MGQKGGGLNASGAIEPLALVREQYSARDRSLQEVLLDLRLKAFPGDFELRPADTAQSPTGQHYTFAIYLNGLPVYGAELKIHQYPGHFKVSYPVLPRSYDAEVGEVAPRPPELRPKVEAQLCWLPRKGQLQKTHWQVFSDQYAAEYDVLSAHGEVILHYDQRVFNKDSTAQGMVFYPDPLSSANVFYGGAYVDNGDADLPELNGERRAVSFRSSFHGGRFHLENNHFRLGEFSAPNIPPVTSLDGQFNYTRSQNGFEDVNAFYHLNRFKNYIDSLGYANLPGFRIDVDAHAFGGADLSAYSASNRLLQFGEGGVDDAEDPDVIVHEFTHALIFAAAGPGNRSVERQCLDEAICDYFAVSYTQILSPNQSNRVFNWDGHNEFWAGRSAESTKLYPSLIFTSIYEHTDIMVATLRDLENRIGRNATWETVLEALFLLNRQSTFEDFGRALLHADSVLHGGYFRYPIADAFIARQILPDYLNLDEESQATAELELRGSINLLYGGEATLRSSSALSAVRIYDLQGRKRREIRLGNAQKDLKIQCTDLPPGIYILEAENRGGQIGRFKIRVGQN